MITAREMKLDEAALVIEYFHGLSAESLEKLGVDPTRLPDRRGWSEWFRRDFDRAVRDRKSFFVTWLEDGFPVGFSSCDKIVYGDHAYMHLHVMEPTNRSRGTGTHAVRLSTDIYFTELALKRLFCEPNAFNVGPNRTLQAAGFRYVMTHRTVPGPLNYHQAVTRWCLEPNPGET
jgi:RimJ/RimL family protein N-acetyltransferase